VLQYFVPNTMEAFTLASSLCVILFISVWILIMACYLRYRKIRPELHAASTFKMPGGVLMAYAVIAFFLFTLVILALEPDTLKALYVSPVWLVVLSVTYYAFYKPRMRKLGQEIF
ncbi:amino acid permease, partial [Acinetobacter baumannii]